MRDISMALEVLRKTITKFAPQGPKLFRTAEAKVEYIFNALAGYDWPKISLTLCYPQVPPRNFRQLMTAFDTWWQQE